MQKLLCIFPTDALWDENFESKYKKMGKELLEHYRQEYLPQEQGTKKQAIQHAKNRMNQMLGLISQTTRDGSLRTEAIRRIWGI